MADVLNDMGMVLDLLSSLVPLATGWWGGRWAVLCAASCLRAGCGVLAGGAKASLSAKFARGADVGELNAVRSLSFFSWLECWMFCGEC